MKTDCNKIEKVSELRAYCHTLTRKISVLLNTNNTKQTYSFQLLTECRVQKTFAKANLKKDNTHRLTHHSTAAGHSLINLHVPAVLKKTS